MRRDTNCRPRRRRRARPRSSQPRRAPRRKSPWQRRSERSVYRSRPTVCCHFMCASSASGSAPTSIDFGIASSSTFRSPSKNTRYRFAYMQQKMSRTPTNQSTLVEWCLSATASQREHTAASTSFAPSFSRACFEKRTVNCEHMSAVHTVAVTIAERVVTEVSLDASEPTTQSESDDQRQRTRLAVFQLSVNIKLILKRREINLLERRNV